MSDHEDVIYLGHMLDMSQKALRLVKGKQRHDYDGDESLRLALAHLLQVIGEAARHVSREFWESHPDIPWKAIVGMRPFDSRHGLWPWARSGFRPTGGRTGATGSARGAPHKVVHDYMDVDEDIVWDTVTTELGPLVDRLKHVVPTD